MSRTTLRRLSLLTAVAVLLGLGLGVVAADPKPTEKALAKVKIGMERAEVLKLLGKPKRDEDVKDEGELCRLYVYKKVGRYKVVNVWFDCDDKVQAVDKAE